MVTRRAMGTGLGLATAAALLVPAMPAEAQPNEHFQWHDLSSEVVEGFCGDMHVRLDTDVSGTLNDNPHGPDGLSYFTETYHGSFMVTNLANDLTFTLRFSGVNKDVRVTDNGDGTLTITSIGPGQQRVYGPDGEFLFNDAGKVTHVFLVDHAGTPTDPSDDVFLEDISFDVVGHSGTAERDFCDDLHEFIGT